VTRQEASKAAGQQAVGQLVDKAARQLVRWQFALHTCLYIAHLPIHRTQRTFKVPPWPPYLHSAKSQPRCAPHIINAASVYPATLTCCTLPGPGLQAQQTQHVTVAAGMMGSH
jgi:hypothetical protein